VQVLKHQVSNVLIFQWRMTSAQSSSKERESVCVKHPSFTAKKEFNKLKPTPRNLCFAMPHRHHLQSLSAQKTL
jgi:hypothetical protein